MKQTEVSLAQAEELVVRYLSPKEVKSYRKNPKKHSEKQVQQIVNSIKEFRFNNPILIDENNELIAGHGRLLAALHLNLDAIPSIRLTHLTDAQKQAYRIADNKLTENGDWDTSLLKLEFKELDDLELNFPLDITGFDSKEMDVFFESPEPADKELNKIPLISTDGVVIQRGDVWQLGKHRILCGDPLEETTFKTLLEGKKADMVFVDPLDRVTIYDDRCACSGVQYEGILGGNQEMSKEEFAQFLKTIFSRLRTSSKNGSLHYICTDWRYIAGISQAGHQYSSIEDLCVWNKTSADMGSLYPSKHELVFVFKNGSLPHTNNVEMGTSGSGRTNVWDYAEVSLIPNTLLFNPIPTAKPVKMIQDAVLDASNRGEIVLDCFLGSGTTLLACERTKRACFGIEQDPVYVNVSICRWKELTGGKAIRLRDGIEYDELVIQKQGDIYGSRI